MSIFSQRMRELREEMGWTQDEVAHKLGMQRPTIAGYESFGKNRIPRQKTLLKIADLYETTTDYLLGYSNQRKRPETFTESDAIELSDETALRKMKASFSHHGKKLSDDVVKEILSFARYKVSQV